MHICTQLINYTHFFDDGVGYLIDLMLHECIFDIHQQFGSFPIILSDKNVLISYDDVSKRALNVYKTCT